MRNYKKLEVWKKAFELVKEVYEITNVLPKSEQYSLISQITRSAISVPSNIAEGAGRRGDKDFARFVDIAIGSSFELETQLLIAKEVYSFEKDKITSVLEELNEIQRMLNSFHQKLTAKS